jgi:hypothetical protein
MHSVGLRPEVEFPSQNWGMANGRCRMHGGKSTGPRTAEGKERIRQAHWKHGQPSAEGIRQHKEFRKVLRSAKELSGYIQQKLTDDSIPEDEANTMFDQLEELESKLFSTIEEFKYLSLSDRLALGKYIRSNLSQGQEFFERLMNHPKSNTPPSGSSAGSEWPKTFVISS